MYPIPPLPALGALRGFDRIYPVECETPTAPRGHIVPWNMGMRRTIGNTGAALSSNWTLRLHACRAMVTRGGPFDYLLSLQQIGRVRARPTGRAFGESGWGGCLHHSSPAAKCWSPPADWRAACGASCPAREPVRTGNVSATPAPHAHGCQGLGPRPRLPAPFAAPKAERYRRNLVRTAAPNCRGAGPNTCSPRKSFSVQVHPSPDASGPCRAKRAGGMLGCVAWMPSSDARLAIGFRKQKVGAAEIEAAALERDDRTCCLGLASGRARAILFYLPAGTVHAIGPGLSLVEVQQNSDNHLPPYDYGRFARTASSEPRHGGGAGANPTRAQYRGQRGGTRSGAGRRGRYFPVRPWSKPCPDAADPVPLLPARLLALPADRRGPVTRRRGTRRSGGMPLCGKPREPRFQPCRCDVTGAGRVDAASGSGGEQALAFPSSRRVRAGRASGRGSSAGPS